MRRIRLTAVAAMAALALTAAGCGDSGSSNEDEVKDSANSFFTAIKDKDFGDACNLLTDKTKDQLEQLGKQLPNNKGGCQGVLEASEKAGAFKNAPKGDELDFEEVKVDGNSATVKTKGDDEPTNFTKVDGDWKVDIKE
jgi:hypothetical protein